MPTRAKKKRPRDPNQRAKLIVDIATGAATEERRDSAPQRTGGLKGGPARAKRLTPIERRHIARLAARSRWKKE